MCFKMVNVPVYGTKLTIGLIDHKLKEHNMLKSVKRKVVKHGQSVNLGCFRVEFIKTNHSIAGCGRSGNIYAGGNHFTYRRL